MMMSSASLAVVEAELCFVLSRPFIIFTDACKSLLLLFDFSILGISAREGLVDRLLGTTASSTACGL
jgi:hypothetical protein